MSRIAVVVPTERLETEFQTFLHNWADLFITHQVHLVVVIDGEDHRLLIGDFSKDHRENLLASDYFDEHVLNLVPHFTPACRNLGFAYVAKYLPEVETIVTLDDDTLPIGDPLYAHDYILRQKMPISWMSSTMTHPIAPVHPIYMRGMPYDVRDEADVWISHGLWRGVPDLDAPTQLVLGERVSYIGYCGPIPKGVYFPFSGMNVGFRREALPYMYWAPTVRLEGAERFDDIWMGINLTREMAALNKSIVSGYAEVQRHRPSGVFSNLNKEQFGMQVNEVYWSGGEAHPWFEDYDRMRNEWKHLWTSSG